MQLKIAELAAFVNDNVNGFAVIDKPVCPCFESNQKGNVMLSLSIIMREYLLRGRSINSLAISGFLSRF